MSGAAPLWTVIGAVAWGTGAFACLVGLTRLLARAGWLGPARNALVNALLANALWAVCGVVAGPAAVTTALAECLRSLACLWALYRLLAIDGRHASLLPVRPVLLAIGLAEFLQLAIQTLLMRHFLVGGLSELSLQTADLLRILVATGGLMLVHNLYAGAAQSTRLSLRWPALALALQWGFDLNHYTVSYLLEDPITGLAALRGFGALAFGALIAVAANRGSENLRFNPSRAVVFQSASLMIVGTYLVFMVVLARWLAWTGKEQAADLQLAVAGSFAGLLAVLASSRAMRGWLRVSLAKHLFRHRYDYREEWLRFTRTMAHHGADGGDLHERVIRVLANMTGSPAGLLLVRDEQGGLALDSRWQWPTAQVPPSAMLADAVAAFEADHSGGFIIDLDELRGPSALPVAEWAGPQRVMPDWLLAEHRAWAIVPLLHFERLVGMVVLARPALARRLDWEDFDLLRVAGQQLASYLAEQAGQEALIEAGRFDDFNRRIAFVMHDIKNLASQLSLLARNAEAHAENPDFRADMLVTLRSASDKLDTLLARLSRYGAAAIDRLETVSANALARRAIAQFRSGQPVELIEAEPCMIAGQGDLLEQALVHLIQNGIDASGPDKPVLVRVATERFHGLIEVVDSGCGMSAEFIRTSLFKPFVSTKPGGFGIGAYEARELIRAMGGTLTVESRERLGSRFTIRLPLAAAAEMLNNFSAKVA